MYIVYFSDFEKKPIKSKERNTPVLMQVSLDGEVTGDFCFNFCLYTFQNFANFFSVKMFLL